MSLIARMAYSPQLVWCLIAGRKEKISTEHMLSIWDLGFANGHNTKNRWDGHLEAICLFKGRLEERARKW